MYLKKRRVLNSATESEEDAIEVISKEKKNANKFSWTGEIFQAVIHKFNDENNGVKVNLNNLCPIFLKFLKCATGRKRNGKRETHYECKKCDVGLTKFRIASYIMK